MRVVTKRSMAAAVLARRRHPGEDWTRERKRRASPKCILGWAVHRSNKPLFVALCACACSSRANQGVGLLNLSLLVVIRSLCLFCLLKRVVCINISLLKFYLF